jgi:hypothetical protein
VGRLYQVGKPPEGVICPSLPKDVRYAVGQPMGALSSWAMLALTHHVIVQYAAHLTRASDEQPRWFGRYAVLGDDVVIADRRVAEVYLRVIESLGVKVGLSKSLISEKKPVLEFAKRFFAPRDCSGIPLREVLAARNTLSGLIEFVRKYKLNVNQTLRFAGFGFRNLGGLNRPFASMSVRLRNLLLALAHPNSPFGCPSLFDW